MSNPCPSIVGGDTFEQKFDMFWDEYPKEGEYAKKFWKKFKDNAFDAIIAADAIGDKNWKFLGLKIQKNLFLSLILHLLSKTALFNTYVESFNISIKQTFK